MIKTKSLLISHTWIIDLTVNKFLREAKISKKNLIDIRLTNYQQSLLGNREVIVLIIYETLDDTD